MGSFVVALFTTLPVLAQTTNTGTVLGLVSDPAGASVPGATVQLQDTATDVVRTVVTNALAHYPSLHSEHWPVFLPNSETDEPWLLGPLKALNGDIKPASP